MVSVCEYVSNSANPYLKPMTAAQMMLAVHSVLEDRFVGRQMPSLDVIRSALLDEVRKALRCQVDSRGLMAVGEIDSFAQRVGVRTGDKSFCVDVSPRWVEEVDAKFHAGPCKRCGLFVAVPWDHDPDECDSQVVSGVLES